MSKANEQSPAVVHGLAYFNRRLDLAVESHKAHSGGRVPDAIVIGERLRSIIDFADKSSSGMRLIEVRAGENGNRVVYGGMWLLFTDEPDVCIPVSSIPG